jgi:hypothetical protein
MTATAAKSCCFRQTPERNELLVTLRKAHTWAGATLDRIQVARRFMTADVYSGREAAGKAAALASWAGTSHILPSVVGLRSRLMRERENVVCERE